MIGGNFVSFNGVTHGIRIARLTFEDAAMQNVEVGGGGKSVTWLRDGASPGVQWVTFEVANQLAGPWTKLGNGKRTAGDWALYGLNLPKGRIRYIRARGYQGGGMNNGSGSIMESIRQVYPKSGGSLCFPARNANGEISIICM